MYIRTFQHGDEVDISRITLDSLRHNAPQYMNRINLSTLVFEFDEKYAGQELFCLEDYNRPVGFISVYGNELVEIRVLHANREQGLGSKLLNFAEDYIKEKGYDQIKLTPLSKRVPFYEKRGYTSIDEYLMTKDLK